MEETTKEALKRIRKLCMEFTLDIKIPEELLTQMDALHIEEIEKSLDTLSPIARAYTERLLGDKMAESAIDIAVVLCVSTRSLFDEFVATRVVRDMSLEALAASPTKGNA